VQNLQEANPKPSAATSPEHDNNEGLVEGASNEDDSIDASFIRCLTLGAVSDAAGGCGPGLCDVPAAIDGRHQTIGRKPSESIPSRTSILACFGFVLSGRRSTEASTLRILIT
jgi:hypothetical protein